MAIFSNSEEESPTIIESWELGTLVEHNIALVMHNGGLTIRNVRIANVHDEGNVELSAIPDQTETGDAMVLEPSPNKAINRKNTTELRFEIVRDGLTDDEWWKACDVREIGV